MYIKGQGTTKNSAEGVKYIVKAANDGEAEAQFYLASFYSTGQYDLPIDNSEALKYYFLAADQGYKQAIYNLGIIYAQGLRV